MEVKAVRREPLPPPIEKITVEMLRSEAEAFAGEIRAAWDFRAKADGYWRSYQASDGTAVTLAKRIEELLK